MLSALGILSVFCLLGCLPRGEKEREGEKGKRKTAWDDEARLLDSTRFSFFHVFLYLSLSTSQHMHL